MKKRFINYKDKRKALLLPLFLMPFLTMAFWALGGGGGNASVKKVPAGLNLELPNAQLKEDRGETKLSYYEAAERDSAKEKEVRGLATIPSSGVLDSLNSQLFAYDPYSFKAQNTVATNEQKVYQKLAELTNRVQTAATSGGIRRANGMQNNRANASPLSQEEESASESKELHLPGKRDPELEQLNGMMERILDIQHPERIQQRLKGESSQSTDSVYRLDGDRSSCSVGLLDTSTGAGQPENSNCVGVWSSGNGETTAAAVYGRQNVGDGSIIKMRLLEDISIAGTRVPAGSLVFGKANLEGERLHVQVPSIRKGNAIYAVKLSVYDLDGMEGIYVPGNKAPDVAKQSAARAVQQMEMGTLDPSIKAQVRGAGIDVAKSLLSRKAKLVKLTLAEGYKILLREN